MFGTMKKAMVAVAAVAAIGTVAPAVASADRWQADNPTVVPYNGPAHTAGTLSLSVGGSTTTCTVTATLDLSHLAGVAHGQVTIFRLGAAAGGSCTTNLPNCSVTASANTTSPWTITTAGTSVTIGGVIFTNSYSGAGCALNGQNITATGSVTGSAAAGSNAITFTNASGLTTPLGPATVNGTVNTYVENAAGGPDLTRPITLVP